MAPLSGKHILIVGGSTGLGFAVAKAALAERAVVTIASSNAEKLRAAATRLGGGVKTVQVDVTSEESIKAMNEQVGTFDHLVYTAGDDPTRLTRFPDFDLEVARCANDVRYWGFVLCARYAKGHVKESITSTAGSLVQKPHPGSLAPGGGAVIGDTRAIAHSFAPEVRVNCVAPGFVDTSMWEHIPQDERDTWFKTEANNTLLKRICTADEVAEAYLYSMKASFVTGQILYVEGGSFLV